MQIRLFGIAKEIAGSDTLAVSAEIETVSELKAWMNEQYPAMRQLNSFAVAVNHEYAEDNHRLSPDNEVAIITQVSGV